MDCDQAFRDEVWYSCRYKIASVNCLRGEMLEHTIKFSWRVRTYDIAELLDKV